MKRVPVLLLALGLLLPAALLADTIIEEIVARVNSEVITRSDYQKGREQLMNDLRQQYGADAEKEFKARQKDLLRDLIDQQLLLDKGKELGISADTELIKKLDEIRKQNNMASMEDLEKAAEQQGVNFEDFKQQIRNSIITQQVIGQEVGRKILVTKEETQKFYEEHKQEMARPEQIRLSEIMVAIPKDATPEQIAAAESKANTLVNQIRGGADFAEVAKRSSEGPSASQGGELGVFRRGTLAKELEDRTFAMKAGEVSDAIRTKQGFVILKVTQHDEAGTPSFKEAEPRVMDALYYQKMQPALRTYLTKLREEAFIDIKQGYTDTGASPNQTKPVITATAAEQAEQAKKKKKKFLIF
ncbi:MAG TPA: peptidylprolyl isomerase [Terriglobales bacterium]|nr:peptidylprolyl isomerase [Terriglobales bacterium]